MPDLRPMSPDEAYGRAKDDRNRPPALVRVKAWRLFELQRLLREKPRTAQELADHFGVARRSVQRDLRALAEGGHGLEQRGYTYALRGTVPHLNAVEALAVHAAARLLYHHTPAFNRHYREGLIKLAAMLPEPARSVALRSAEHLPHRPDESQALELVAQAWFERRVLRFDHCKPGQREPERGFELQVYFVEISRENLVPYVIGWERARRGAMRTFKLSRMHHLALLKDTFDEALVRDFDPRAYLSDAWGVVGGQHVGSVTVRLRFEAGAAYRILEGGYPNMSEPMKHGDGAVEVDVRAGVDRSGLPRELLPFILGFGPRVEVLSPHNVREHWLSELRETLRRHGGDAI
ncbi:helix-turn-helix transcriptional regulator [Deinococcus planocerae]|uniref:helix-turn-helix transcriptional regulator n=1 Tax=Deinococcus planocerae TaxID=1737569 RepID=UPI001FE9C568|nr:WYL domain-containing protein [Deinococcus planocerae]